MASVEVDFVKDDDMTAAHALASMASGLAVETEVVTEQGPGGGHPVGRVTGSASQLEAFLNRHGYELDAHPIAE